MGTHLVGGKAIMQLNYANLIPTLTGTKPSICEYFICTSFCHAVTDNFHRATTLESTGAIGCQVRGYNFDSLVLETVFVHEIFRSNDAGSSAVLKRTGEKLVCHRCGKLGGQRTNRCRATHKLGELSGDLGSRLDLLDAPSIPKLRIWIVHRVLMILRSCMASV